VPWRRHLPDRSCRRNAGNPERQQYRERDPQACPHPLRGTIAAAAKSRAGRPVPMPPTLEASIRQLARRQSGEMRSTSRPRDLVAKTKTRIFGRPARPRHRDSLKTIRRGKREWSMIEGYPRR
jgi:hypothetical protein